MNAIDKEFEDAAKSFARAQDNFQFAQMRNQPTDPVERQEARVEYERIRGELFEAQARMDKARKAKYPNSI